MTKLQSRTATKLHSGTIHNYLTKQTSYSCILYLERQSKQILAKRKNYKLFSNSNFQHPFNREVDAFVPPLYQPYLCRACIFKDWKIWGWDNMSALDYNGSILIQSLESYPFFCPYWAKKIVSHMLKKLKYHIQGVWMLHHVTCRTMPSAQDTRYVPSDLIKARQLAARLPGTYGVKWKSLYDWQAQLENGPVTARHIIRLM